MTTQTPAPAPAIAHDVPCMTCGYNLRGLNPQGVCPECATSIGLSLSEQSGKVSTTMLIWSRCMIVGLISWVVLSSLALTQSRSANRGDGSSRVVRTNYPGPKLWITDLRPAFEQELREPDAFSGITYALGCLIVAYLLTSPRTSDMLEATFSLRRITRWFAIVAGAAVIGHQIGYFDWRWTDVTENAIPIIATVLLYLHLAVIARGLGLRPEAKTLQFAAIIAAILMAAAIPLRYFEYDPGFRNWSYNDPLADMMFSAYCTVAIIGAVLAAGSMIRMALGMIPMAFRTRAN